MGRSPVERWVEGYIEAWRTNDPNEVDGVLGVAVLDLHARNA